MVGMGSGFLILVGSGERVYYNGQEWGEALSY